jgi:hypothetical protein
LKRGIRGAHARTTEILAAHQKSHRIDAVPGPPVGRFYFANRRWSSLRRSIGSDGTRKNANDCDSGLQWESAGAWPTHFGASPPHLHPAPAKYEGRRSVFG